VGKQLKLKGKRKKKKKIPERNPEKSKKRKRNGIWDVRGREEGCQESPQ